jgi:hypothetical protein
MFVARHLIRTEPLCASVPSPCVLFVTQREMGAARNPDEVVGRNDLPHESGRSWRWWKINPGTAMEHVRDQTVFDNRAALAATIFR